MQIVSPRQRERIQASYERVLMFLNSRKTAYGLVFGTKGNYVVPISAKQFVLNDLKKFCRANRSVYNKDQRLTDVMIGRHEVFLRICQHLNMNLEQLYAVYNALPIQTAAPTGDDNADI